MWSRFYQKIQPSNRELIYILAVMLHFSNQSQGVQTLSAEERPIYPPPYNGAHPSSRGGHLDTEGAIILGSVLGGIAACPYLLCGIFAIAYGLYLCVNKCQSEYSDYKSKPKKIQSTTKDIEMGKVVKSKEDSSSSTSMDEVGDEADEEEKNDADDDEKEIDFVP